jgi:hypothetical protein
MVVYSTDPELAELDRIEKVIVENKAVQNTILVHNALPAHLNLARLRLGFMVNFNVPLIKYGINRTAA